MKRISDWPAIARSMMTVLTILLGTAMASAQPESRNPWLWPFATNSIWNTPIGSEAVYVHAGLDQHSDEWIDYDFEYHERMLAGDPLVTVYNPGPWDDRCNSTTVSWIQSMKVNRYFRTEIARPGWTPNNVAAFLQPDGAALIEMEPTERCMVPDGPVYGWPLTGENIYESGHRGTHYGSGMSGIGGSIRVGELTGSDPIRHVLKINLWGLRYLYAGTPNGSEPKGFGFRWPANNADGYAQQSYGGTNPEVAMGSLLAIPPSMTYASLGIESELGRKMFDVLRDYGAYVVDDTAWYNFHFDGEYGVPEEVELYYGMPMRGAIDNPIKRDLERLKQNLHVVSNNTPETIGGPGERLSPLAPDTFRSINEVGGGEYIIQSGHSGMLLEVADASMENNASVQQATWSGHDHQVWLVEHLGNGYYSIKAKHSGKGLDVRDISYDNGAAVQVWDFWSGDNQLWSIWPNQDDTYRIIARHSGLCLQITGASTAEAAPAEQWRFGSLDHQCWRLIDKLVEAPTHLNAIAVDHKTIELSWTDNAYNESDYVIQRKPLQRSDQWQTIVELGPNSTQYTDTDQLFGLIRYYYRVGAVE